MTDPVRVLVADDQALLRGSFRLLIDSAPDLTVVGEAADGAVAVRLAAELSPDVVLMDVRMPTMDGMEATRRICANPGLAGTRVLVLTMFDSDEYVFAGLRAGACGFLLKDTPPQDLLAGIRMVAAGNGLLAPAVTRRLIASFASRPDPVRPPTPTLAGITEREREVLELVARGLPNGEIAASLQLSVPTVKTHISHLLAKLDARDRVQLVVIAYESGVVSPGSN